VYDLESGDVYIYYKMNYDEAITYNLMNELKKGQHVEKLE